MGMFDGFDARTVEPNQPLQPVPEGIYLATLTKGERKDTKSGTGQLLALEFTICDGPYKGRKVQARLNLWNANETAVKIAWGDFSALCRAVNVPTPRDVCDLYNLPLEIIVGLTNQDDKGRMFNEIKGYQKRGTSAAAAPAQPSAPAPDGDTGAKPGWM